MSFKYELTGKHVHTYLLTCMYVCMCIYVTGPAKTDHASTKNRQAIFVRLLYHNLINIYTTTTNS